MSGCHQQIVRVENALFWKSWKLKIWQDVDIGGSFILIISGKLEIDARICKIDARSCVQNGASVK